LRGSSGVVAGHEMLAWPCRSRDLRASAGLRALTAQEEHPDVVALEHDIAPRFRARSRRAVEVLELRRLTLELFRWRRGRSSIATKEHECRRRPDERTARLGAAKGEGARTGRRAGSSRGSRAAAGWGSIARRRRWPRRGLAEKLLTRSATVLEMSGKLLRFVPGRHAQGLESGELFVPRYEP
jgi:hypothetical protein